MRYPQRLVRLACLSEWSFLRWLHHQLSDFQSISAWQLDITTTAWQNCAVRRQGARVWKCDTKECCELTKDVLATYLRFAFLMLGKVPKILSQTVVNDGDLPWYKVKNSHQNKSKLIGIYLLKLDEWSIPGSFSRHFVPEIMYRISKRKGLSSNHHGLKR